jgi:hypothetical protein
VIFDFYLTWVAVDDPPVLRSLRSLYDELLHVGPEDLVLWDSEGLIDQVEELAHVPEQLLADALAS